MKNIFIFLMILSFVGCYSGELKPIHPSQRHRRAEGEAPTALPMEGATRAPIIDKTLLFPLGVYQHKITLYPAKGKPRTFNGVVALTENQIQVVGLSPFNTTFFRIKDTFNPKKFEAKFYFPLPKKAKLKFYEFYAALKETLLLKKTDKECRPTIVINQKSEIQFDFSSYDENDIPRTLQITHPSFRTVVEVTSYEF